MKSAPAEILQATIIAVFFPLGCGDSAPVPVDGSAARVPGDPGATLGTGTTAFEPLAPGDELPLIAGPQGGYHFIVNATITGILPGDPTMPGQLGNPQTWFYAYLDDDRIDPELPPYRLGYRELGGQYELPSGRILRLEQERLGELVPAIYGQTVRIEVRILDASGAEVGDEIEVTAIEAPDAPDDLDGGIGDLDGGT